MLTLSGKKHHDYGNIYFMKAMQLVRKGQSLKLVDVPIPKPRDSEVLIKIVACGVCRTDVHIVDGELPNISYPIIPGHQIVGKVEKAGKDVLRFGLGDRVGVSWLAWTCGRCRFCQRGQENLCKMAKFTGRDVNGGFAQYCMANANYCFNIPIRYDDVSVAPLLCAGIVGYRAYRMVAQLDKIGFYGFGSSAHILIQIAKSQGKKVYVFTRQNDQEGQKLAWSLGATWVGSSWDYPPQPLEGIVIFAPVGELIPQALKVVDKGGVVVCAGIHMSDIPSFAYKLLWGEKILTTVTNLSRKDGEEFLRLAQKIPLKLNIHRYKFSDINLALSDVREGRINGSAVMVVDY